VIGLIAIFVAAIWKLAVADHITAER